MTKGKMVQLVVLGLCVTALVLAATVEPALAKASKIGKNVGDEIETWAKAILFGLVGLIAIPVLVKRDVAGGLVLTLLVIVVGGFVFAGSEVKQVIRALWQTIGG